MVSTPITWLKSSVVQWGASAVAEANLSRRSQPTKRERCREGRLQGLVGGVSSIKEKSFWRLTLAHAGKRGAGRCLAVTPRELAAPPPQLNQGHTRRTAPPSPSSELNIVKSLPAGRGMDFAEGLVAKATPRRGRPRSSLDSHPHTAQDGLCQEGATLTLAPACPLLSEGSMVMVASTSRRKHPLAPMAAPAAHARAVACWFETGD